MKNPYWNHNGMAYTDPRVVWKEGRASRDPEVSEHHIVIKTLREKLAEQAELVKELVEALDICVDWFRNKIVTQAVTDGQVPYFEGYKRGVMALAQIPGHYTHTPCTDCGHIGRNNCPTCDDSAHEEAIAKAREEKKNDS
ncbi:hypothetical protein LCGC14_1306860 [marine sediment metagenome]|uniref:Uncharacterized protein n=1 Tax=marine sediment metagenome TaxID=412755 RepID=A0A0F9KNF5_9ZZZZ